MSRVSETAQTWKNFAIDRTNAKNEVEAEAAKIDQQIAELKSRKQELLARFDAEWDRKKEQARRDRDEAIKDALREGQSGTSILKEMRSNNTVLVYDLASQVRAEQAAEARAKGIVEPVPDLNIKGLSWRYHPHQGARGWLLSVDGSYIKHYAPDADPESASEDRWFVADRELNFIAGSKELFDGTAKAVMGKKVKLLEELLAGEYSGPIKIAVGEPVFTH
jgi:hypothetical protein